MAATGQVAFGFDAKGDGAVFHGECNVVDRLAGVRVKCLDVTSLVVVGTHARFRGNATVNGVATTYVIDVDDLGERGTGVDTFRLVTPVYETGGVLTQGNIQIH